MLQLDICWGWFFLISLLSQRCAYALLRFRHSWLGLGKISQFGPNNTCFGRHDHGRRRCQKKKKKKVENVPKCPQKYLVVRLKLIMWVSTSDESVVYRNVKGEHYILSAGLYRFIVSVHLAYTAQQVFPQIIWDLSNDIILQLRPCIFIIVTIHNHKHNHNYITILANAQGPGQWTYMIINTSTHILLFLYPSDHMACKSCAQDGKYVVNAWNVIFSLQSYVALL